MIWTWGRFFQILCVSQKVQTLKWFWFHPNNMAPPSQTGGRKECAVYYITKESGGMLSHPDVGTPFSNEIFNFGSLCAQVGHDGHSLAWKINICHFHMHDNWNFQQASQTIAIACADTIVDQSGLILLWQSLKWQKITICKVLPFYLENIWASSVKDKRKIL